MRPHAKWIDDVTTTKKLAIVVLFVGCAALAGYAAAARQYHQEFGVFDAQGNTIGYVTYPCAGPAIIDGDTNGTWVLEYQESCSADVKDPN